MILNFTNLDNLHLMPWLDRDEPLLDKMTIDGILDFGYISCECMDPAWEKSSRVKPCSHIRDFVWNEGDKNLLWQIAHRIKSYSDEELLLNRIEESAKLLDVWLPLMPSQSLIVADTIVTLRPQAGQLKLWNAELAICAIEPDSPLANLGTIDIMNFSRRKLMQRVVEAFYALALKRCERCEYKPEIDCHPIDLHSSSKRKLIKRGGFMTSLSACEVCYDMDSSIRSIKGPIWKSLPRSAGMWG